MSGTVNISRGIWHDAAFKDEPFSEREAFIWLIMEASYRPREKRVGSITVKLERGQLVTSVRFMCSAWSWSKSRVDRFLKRLEKRDMIGTDSGIGINVITVCKYNDYQNTPDFGGTANFPKRDSSGTAAGQQRDKPNTGLIPEAIQVQKEEAGAFAKNDLFDVSNGPPEPKPETARLPPDWTPNDADIEYALSKQIHTDDIREMADDFQTYWGELSGAKSRKSQKGWAQCWRNHVNRNAATYIRNRRMAQQAYPGGYGQGGGIAGAVARRRSAN